VCYVGWMGLCKKMAWVEHITGPEFPPKKTRRLVFRWIEFSLQHPSFTESGSECATTGIFCCYILHASQESQKFTWLLGATGPEEESRFAEAMLQCLVWSVLYLSSSFKLTIHHILPKKKKNCTRILFLAEGLLV
jgi:hypothetical protein